MSGVAAGDGRTASRGWSGAATGPVRPIGGFHEPDVIRWQEVRWTNGRGVLLAELPPGRSGMLTAPARPLRARRRRPRRWPSRSTATSWSSDVLRAPRSKREVVEPMVLSVPVRGRPGGSTVVIRSEAGAPTTSPATATVASSGCRSSVSASVTAAGPRCWPGPRSPAPSRPGSAWLDSYDRVVSNSAFTRRFVEQWWERESDVLEPPVGLREPGEKASLILSVGRFFAPGGATPRSSWRWSRRSGAWAAAADGWELHLVGGCGPEDLPYLAEVRAAAEGLPVVVHVDATGAELDRLYRSRLDLLARHRPRRGPRRRSGAGRALRHHHGRGHVGRCGPGGHRRRWPARDRARRRRRPAVHRPRRPGGRDPGADRRPGDGGRPWRRRPGPVPRATASRRSGPGSRRWWPRSSPTDRVVASSLSPTPSRRAARTAVRASPPGERGAADHQGDDQHDRGQRWLQPSRPRKSNSRRWCR